jgi:hypothetical protein
LHSWVDILFYEWIVDDIMITIPHNNEHEQCLLAL